MWLTSVPSWPRVFGRISYPKDRSLAHEILALRRASTQLLCRVAGRTRLAAEGYPGRSSARACDSCRLKSYSSFPLSFLPWACHNRVPPPNRYRRCRRGPSRLVYLVSKRTACWDGRYGKNIAPKTGGPLHSVYEERARTAVTPAGSWPVYGAGRPERR